MKNIPRKYVEVVIHRRGREIHPNRNCDCNLFTQFFRGGSLPLKDLEWAKKILWNDLGLELVVVLDR